jgi:integrase
VVKLPVVRSHRGQPWPTEEARRFLESARADLDPLYAAYVLVLVLGMRKGELLGLGWDQVDQAGAELRVGCEKAGVRTITVHDARKTCATLLVDLDVHPRVLMAILRHAQISVT